MLEPRYTKTAKEWPSFSRSAAVALELGGSFARIPQLFALQLGQITTLQKRYNMIHPPISKEMTNLRCSFQPQQCDESRLKVG